MTLRFGYQCLWITNVAQSVDQLNQFSIFTNDGSVRKSNPVYNGGSSAGLYVLAAAGDHPAVAFRVFRANFRRPGKRRILFLTVKAHRAFPRLCRQRRQNDYIRNALDIVRAPGANDGARSCGIVGILAELAPATAAAQNSRPPTIKPTSPPGNHRGPPLPATDADQDRKKAENKRRFDEIQRKSKAVQERLRQQGLKDSAGAPSRSEPPPSTPPSRRRPTNV